MARVLVIDDSPTTVELMTTALGNAGFTAASAMDLAALDQRLTEGPYDLVLIDVNMPEMYGDDIVEFLRVQRKLTARLVLYSDLPEPELAKKTKTSGADGYICKGWGLEQALVQVGRLIAVSKPEPKKKRVLIVDDSEMVVRVLEHELASKGFEVFTADSADKATKIILKKPTRPDLVLLDVNMPNVNGEQLCRFIKSNSLFKGIKVLLCSSEAPEELQRICREAGADGYLPKDAVLSKAVSRELS